jgi:putative peptidoglycan lipid II flippase
MSRENKNILKSSSGLGMTTLFSRLLGLWREMLEASVLGGGAIATAWQLAYMLPNLFRRILGEGALGTALIPMISHIVELRGKDDAKKQLAAVFFWLGLLLIIISITVSAVALLLKFWIKGESGIMALNLIPVMMPYAFFICLIGIAGSIMNTMRVFVLPALGSLLLNIFLIACMLLICPGVKDMSRLLDWMAYAVLFSGFIQLLLLLALMRYHGIFPNFTWENIKNIEVFSELWRLTLPALFGASVVQISFLLDRGMAYWLGPQAVPALTFSDRVVYVPIGVFAVSLGAVLLSSMSKSVAKGNTDEFVASLNLGLRHVLYLCVPVAIFFVVFREPILRLLFLRGRFTESDLQATSWAMLFFGFGIPSFCSIKIVLAGFYSRKDMKTPVKVSFCCIGLNLILNLCLMFWLKQGGLALATVISSITNNCVLLYILRRDLNRQLGISHVVRTLIRSIIAAAIPTLILFCFYAELLAMPSLHFLSPDLIPLIICGVAFWLSYGLISWMVRSKELPELFTMFHRS